MLLSVLSWLDIDEPNLAELLDPILTKTVFEEAEVVLGFVALASFERKCRVKLFLCSYNNYEESSCVLFFRVTAADL